jgi:PAS domain S-box-containing protein
MDEPEEISRIRSILKENPKGLTTEEIAKRLPLNRTSTAKYLNTLLISGQAEMRTFGRAKVFTLSQRIPFSQMLNLSSDLLVVLDQDLSIRQVNEPLLKTFGFLKEDLIDTRIENSQLFPYFESFFEKIRDSSTGKEITRMERMEIREKEFFFRMKLIPVVYDQGDRGLAIILQDITELKQYQQHLEGLVEERTRELRETNDKLLTEMKERQKSGAALEESERKYRELVENANSIILRVNDRGTILFFNEFAERFFKRSQAEMLGKNIIGTIIPAIPEGKTPEEYIKEFLIPSEYMIYNEIPCNGNVYGDKSWVAWTIRPVADSEQKPIEYLLVGMDITERKNVETALHRINARLNLISSITRHDILNKLTIISGTISLLKDLITDTTQVKYLQQAENAMIAIKNQILFTRDFKDMGMEKAYWHDMDDIFQKMREGIKSGKDVINIPEHGIEIFADPWLNRVFSNLLDYIRHGNETAMKISVKYQESENGLGIIIESDGTGVPADKKERIFERGSGESNGYDLFLTREILAITGLTIVENGDPEAGMRFVIQIPRQTYRWIKKG